MRMIDIIEKTQHGQALKPEEIHYLIQGVTDSSIPDYQISAWLMAVYFKGLTKEETSQLTLAMAESGDELDLSAIQGIKVDKHSTGGVGDTTSLILGPLVASCGVPVAKMSGRGLGHTGGTVDKLEAIPHFQTELSTEAFIQQVNEHQLAIVGQSGNLTPADKAIYALRDVTGTVQSIPLISASIMSKKIASGADAIVLDVKVGDGAFMKTIEEAEQLAHAMVEIGRHVGRKTSAVISDMNQPLGNAVGNALEVKEAVDVLAGKGPEDLTELSIVLGAQMLLAAGRVDTRMEGEELLQEKIEGGQALAKFKEFIEAQGGDSAVIEKPELLPQAKYTFELSAPRSGFLSRWVAHEVGVAASMLGAGRQAKDDVIDPAVGLILHKKVGDLVKEGDSLATLYANREDIQDVMEVLREAVTIEDEAEAPTLIHRIITA